VLYVEKPVFYVTVLAVGKSTWSRQFRTNTSKSDRTAFWKKNAKKLVAMGRYKLIFLVFLFCEYITSLLQKIICGWIPEKNV
jgi:hypothetical protein